MVQREKRVIFRSSKGGGGCKDSIPFTIHVDARAHDRERSGIVTTKDSVV
jgi:hypothetical protein